ncbi:hypothetical protein BAJUN_02090 [Bajunvirus bajun]|uniref:Uncharacterized protein n=1 Tax=Brevundimonas phage vB_BgoS-Bajun TaxID=2948594 RepID=A0A9E7SS20_9CAUD|nr:hypothetical protein BAJUN_02090 [Brevundimonas phage vB_BgoS-Bajun]
MAAAVCTFAADGTPTYAYAKVGEAVGYDPADLSLVVPDNIAVHDVKTGAPAVDPRGRKYAFLEVNAAEGWGVVVDYDRPWDGDDMPTKRITGHFEIRLVRPKKTKPRAA